MKQLTLKNKSLANIHNAVYNIPTTTQKINRGKFATDKSHYPPNYQAYLEVTPCNLREKAKEIGPHTSKLMDELLPMKNTLRYLRRAQGLISLLKFLLQAT